MFAQARHQQVQRGDRQIEDVPVGQRGMGEEKRERLRELPALFLYASLGKGKPEESRSEVIIALNQGAVKSFSISVSRVTGFP